MIEMNLLSLIFLKFVLSLEGVEVLSKKQQKKHFGGNNNNNSL
jgi:hypothetical protein